MNTTLAVVVSAIVILITALVVITIFGGGASQVSSLTNAKSICETQAYSSCRSTNSMPLTWNIPSVSIPASGGGNQIVACKDVPGIAGSDCSSFGGTSAPSGGAVTYTCTQTSGQSCLAGAACPQGKAAGSGTCPSGQACCK